MVDTEDYLRYAIEVSNGRDHTISGAIAYCTVKLRWARERGDYEEASRLYNLSIEDMPKELARDSLRVRVV